uniref:DUF6443 domain-containing protein n=1 Tax=Pedobacter schmidteae TaxID=2201271 RepID=UPI000EB460F8|nr:DUF6443 domain-containing protein [Pedobacter schmidteae]
MKKQLNLRPEMAWKYVTICLVSVFGKANAQQPNITLNTYNNQTEIKATNSVTLLDGFHIPAGKTVRIFTGASFQKCVPFAGIPSTNQNYVSTKIFKIPGVVTDADVNQTGRSTCEVNQTVQYFDGLGRPLQTVTVQGSPAFKDVVQPVAYDAFGREQFKYLPYVDPGTGNGTYKANALSSGQGLGLFYNPPGITDPQQPNGIVKTAFPFSETRFEASPLNRVLEQGASGASWQLNAGHSQKMEYSTNITDEVKLWTVTSNGATGTTNYAPGRLYKQISKDENWVAADGKSGTTEEFKDLEGRVVLKRTFNTGEVTHSTYYVYDDLGNLRYVLPPAVNENGQSPLSSFTEADDTFKQFIYGYHYDGRKRLIEKQIPGKGWEEMIYNKLDQLVLSRDAVQENAGQWLFTKYDALGRVVMTGLYSDTTSRGGLQTTVNNQTNLWESRVSTGVGYDNLSFPQTIAHYYSINYYDNYDFPGNSFPPPDGVTQMQAARTKGLQTGGFVYLINSSTRYLSVNYYDKEGRVIRTAAENHLGGKDITDNTWNFAGELTASTRTHTASATGPATTIANRYEYDHMGRKLATMESINEQQEVVLSKLTYNEIGQLLNKDLHSIDNGATFIQQNSYAYNERGWMSRINDPNNVTSNKVFGMELNYANKPDAFNGNIGSLSWQTKVPGGIGLSQQLQSYSYDYDKLNRLKKAGYTTPGLTDKFNEELGYDVMGNITSLKRKNAVSGYLNDLSYSYTNSGIKGNKLWGVSDVGSAAQSSAYDYDENGNQKSDSRKGITISYNYLNLPQTITKASTGESINYVYDATGRKLKKVFGINIRDYVGGIEYNNGAIDFIQTEEGRALPDTNYTYEYMLKDHLGNTRATIKGNGDIVQVQDYYAFGMEMNPGNALSASPQNQYKYNGKEMQSELGLDQLDYGARFYDPLIGRWNVIDPKAEDYMHWSPYNYAMNSPLVNIDPDGMSSEAWTTRYVNPHGQTIVNTDDGREDVVKVPWARIGEFLENAYWSSRPGTGQINSIGWNDHWRNEFGIMIKESTLNNGGHYLLETEEARAAQAKYLITGKVSDLQDFVSKRLFASWSDPMMVVNYIAAGVQGYAALQGKIHFGYPAIENNTKHATRYLTQAGLNIEKVKAAISQDLKLASFYKSGESIKGVITVDGVTIKYSGMKLSNGDINIGTMQPPRR